MFDKITFNIFRVFNDIKINCKIVFEKLVLGWEIYQYLDINFKLNKIIFNINKFLNDLKRKF